MFRKWFEFIRFMLGKEDFTSPREQRQRGLQCTLFVANLDKNMDRHEFIKLFRKCGSVVNVVTPQGKNFGFVTMENKTQAAKVIELLDGRKILGKSLRISFAKPRS